MPTYSVCVVVVLILVLLVLVLLVIIVVDDNDYDNFFEYNDKHASSFFLSKEPIAVPEEECGRGTKAAIPRKRLATIGSGMPIRPLG